MKGSGVVAAGGVARQMLGAQGSMLVILVNLRRGEPLAAYLVARESIPARLTVAECIHRTCGYDGDCAAGKEPEFHVVRPEIGRRNLRILVQEQFR